MPKVSTQVYMLDRKIWKLFRPRRNGRKRTKCDQFFCPTSDFSDFCNPCFFYHTFRSMMWVLLTKPMQKSVITVCLHCSFARLKDKHTCMGVLGTNVAAMSWLHWSPVLGLHLYIFSSSTSKPCSRSPLLHCAPYDNPQHEACTYW